MGSQSDFRIFASGVALARGAGGLHAKSGRRGVPIRGGALAVALALAFLVPAGAPARAEPGTAPRAGGEPRAAAPSVPDVQAPATGGNRAGKDGGSNGEAARPEPEIGGCPYRGRRLELIV